MPLWPPQPHRRPPIWPGSADVTPCCWPIRRGGSSRGHARPAWAAALTATTPPWTRLIARIEVPAAVDAVLYLWAAVPMIEHALAVMNAWGFTYRSAMVWDKGRDGTGYWFRNRVEFLMVGTRGAVPALVPGDQPQQVLRNAPGEHSAKPVAAYQ